MATLWIKECERMPQVGGAPQIWAEPALNEQAKTITGTSAQSDAFNAQTKFVIVTSDSAFCYLVGANPTAATTNFRIPAGVVLAFSVTPGQKIAAVTTT